MSNNTHTIECLRRLENQSWESTQQKHLYSTPLVPGFPWFTVPSPAAVSVAKEATEPDNGKKAGEGVTIAGAARRHVVPYAYTFKVFAKGRWVGQPLLSVYTEELAHHRRAYYEACWQRARLRCIKRQEKNEGATHNLKRRDVKRAVHSCAVAAAPNKTAESLFAGVDAMTTQSLGQHEQQQLTSSSAQEVILEQGDVVLHTVHRHEVPLLLGTSGVEPLQLLAAPIAACGLLVLLKPSGVPTHPTGRYYYNSVISMLEYVLTPKRLRAWLWEGDALLQSLVCTSQLAETDKQELQDYYEKERGGDTNGEAGEAVDADKAPRPCYRLDKATSGILLLGVHQDATAHVARVLMEKSKSVDCAVQTALSRVLSCPDIRSPSPRSPVLSDFADALVNTNFGVRKRYLARVKGNFPSTMQHLCTHMEQIRKEGVPPFLLPVPLSASQMQALLRRSDVQALTKVKAHLRQYTDATAEADDAMCYPNGVLLASPVEDVHHYLTRKTANDQSHQSHQGGTTNAVTIVQCLSVTGAQGAEESVLLCIPLTGRQNQIRLHCRDWLCPIVNDPLGYKPSALFHQATTSSPTGADTDTDCNASTALYFDENELPPAFYEEEFPEEFKHYKAKLAASRLAVASAAAATTHDGTADPLACESICYECSGELPVATFSASEGTSAICLHAWEYEMDARLLYAKSAATGATSVRAPAPAQANKRNKMEEQSAKETVEQRTSADEKGEGSEADDDAFVVFRALPLPLWV